MQEDAQRAMKNAALFAGASPAPMPGVGGPYKYSGKKKEYFESPTTAYVFENAKYASNYYAAQVQGVMPGTFETERGAYIRTMDIVEQTTGTKMPNDYQSIYFQDARIRGLYTGAKVKYGGNTWLAISPFNVADPLSSAVIRRCNAIWKHLDYYGNVLCEPFIFQDARAQATASDYTDYNVLPRWYQKCVMQLNEETKDLAYNRRVILGSSAIEVRGLVDFITDFTGETNEESRSAEPTHVMFFDAQYQEPNLAIDDMERGIAGGKAFSWVISATYSDTMGVGDSQKLNVSSLRNGEAPDTDTHEVSYLFESSNESVATVDDEGNVTGIVDGNATITITLEQNQDIKTEIQITVSSEQPEPVMVFTPEIPDKLKQMQSYTGIISVMQGASEIGAQITMTAYGATEEAEAAYNTETHTLTITAYEASQTPLSLVFKDEEHGITYTKNIRLEGF